MWVCGSIKLWEDTGRVKQSSVASRIRYHLLVLLDCCMTHVAIAASGLKWPPADRSNYFQLPSTMDSTSLAALQRKPSIINVCLSLSLSLSLSRSRSLPETHCVGCLHLWCWSVCAWILRVNRIS